MATKLLELASGGLIFGYVVAALFFFRFWRRTRDSLFMAFGVAFVLMAVNQLALALLPVQHEELYYIYVIRISAFLLILGAIVNKNIGKRR